MTPAQQQRVRDVFEALVETDSNDIDSRLAAAVPDDDVVRAEVLSLLQHHSRAGAFLESPAVYDADVPAFGAGTVLGPYTIVREIGHGGMGRVYLATDARLRRSVSLKTVRSDPRDPAYRGRLQREAQMAASLAHPGICAVYALEEFDGQLFLVTEFIEGRTLREEIDSGVSPTVSHVVETMRDLAVAVGAAHARGITHRDLKPENIMRTADGRLKVLDFGVARANEVGGEPLASGGTLPGTLIGTPAYMSPEQLDGRAVGPASDVFTLGIVIYELAAGVHPFAAATGLGTAARIVGSTPRPLATVRSDLPAALVHSVERALSKRPEDRFQSAAEMVAALETAHASPPAGGRRAWWRVHQAVAIALYLIAAGAAWQVKEWEPSMITRWAFLLLGVGAAVNGTIRGHLLFIDAAHPQRLAAERSRVRGLSTALDVAIAACLLLAAIMISQARPLVAVLTMGLAAGIATAAVVIEPSTSQAALDVP